MPDDILILADDLSGAADCAAACVRAGLQARVCLDGAAWPGRAPGGALAVDLDTRQRSAQEARAATLGARHLIEGRVLYRKIDSTLRGHVGVDVAATLEAAGPGAFAVVCPAYPATGRTVCGGQVFVRGVPLADTETWRHEGRGEPDLRATLQAAGLAVASIPLAVVRQGVQALQARMTEALAAGARALVCDAQSDADMIALVAASLPLAGAVWAGSGGMAAPLAATLSRRAPQDRPAPARLRGPHLVVVGSASSVSRRQLAELARDPGVVLIRMSPQMLLEGPDGPGWRPASRALVAAVGKPGKDVVVAAIDPDAPVDPANGPRLAAALGHLVGRQLGRFGALAATGGETARALLQAIGARALCVERELEPGIPLSRLEESGLPVVTKAGAFGDPLSLVRCVQALRALPLAPAGVFGASVPE
jgi:uncharacterized protein YgbK (DUF1537 family)